MRDRRHGRGIRGFVRARAGVAAVEFAFVLPPGTDPNAVVTVTYEHIGMGFAANPFGPDVWPLTTVEISGITFEFFTPFITVANFQFPECSATLTGEDFTT